MVSSGSSGPYHVQLILFFCIHHQLLHCHPVFGCMPVSQVSGDVSMVWPVWMVLVLHVAVIATVHMWQCIKLLLHVTSHMTKPLLQVKVTWLSLCCIWLFTWPEKKHSKILCYFFHLILETILGKPVEGLDPILVHCLSKGMFATTNIR